MTRNDGNDCINDDAFEVEVKAVEGESAQREIALDEADLADAAPLEDQEKGD